MITGQNVKTMPVSTCSIVVVGVNQNSIPQHPAQSTPTSIHLRTNATLCSCPKDARAAACFSLGPLQCWTERFLCKNEPFSRVAARTPIMWQHNSTAHHLRSPQEHVPTTPRGNLATSKENVELRWCPLAPGAGKNHVPGCWQHNDIDCRIQMLTIFCPISENSQMGRADQHRRQTDTLGIYLARDRRWLRNATTRKHIPWDGTECYC